MATPAQYMPEGFRTVTPYLHVHHADRFIDFVKQAFGAEQLMRFDTPEGRVMHAAVRIGDSVLEMGDPDPNLPVALHMYVPEVDAVYERALAAGASSLHEPTNQSYGDREGGVKDPFEITWYISTHQGKSYVPEGLHTITPYLHVEGASGLIEFVKQAFGAAEKERISNPDGTIAHAKVLIGNSVLELGDAHDPWRPTPAALHLYVPDADAVYNQAIKSGARSEFAPYDAEYGDRSSGVIDRFQNHWYIHTKIQ